MKLHQLLTADAIKLARFNQSEQFGLKGEGGIADFVEKQNPTPCAFRITHGAGPACRERRCLLSKELALHQPL